MARMDIRQGLNASKLYIFRLGILRNPNATPQRNKWLIEYGNETSEPIDGFPIWAFYYGKITASDTSASSSIRPTYNLVTIELGVTNTIPGGGLIEVSPPKSLFD